MIPFVAAIFSNQATRGDLPASAAPTFISLGTSAAAAAAGVTPGLPAGRQSGDLLILFVQCDNSDSALADNPADNAYPGWTLIGRAPAGTGSGGAFSARGTCYYAWSQDIASAPTLPSTGDHTFAQIGCWRGVKVATPIGVVGSGLASAAASFTLTGVTTPVDKCRVVVFFVNTSDTSTQNPVTSIVNANLLGLAIHGNSRTNAGKGGSLVVADGVMTTAGATGNVTGTTDNSSAYRWVIFALEPL